MSKPQDITCPNCGITIPADDFEWDLCNDAGEYPLWYTICPGCGYEQSQEVEVDE